MAWTTRIRIKFLSPTCAIDFVSRQFVLNAFADIRNRWPAKRFAFISLTQLNKFHSPPFATRKPIIIIISELYLYLYERRLYRRFIFKPFDINRTFHSVGDSKLELHKAKTHWIDRWRNKKKRKIASTSISTLSSVRACVSAYFPLAFDQRSAERHTYLLTL